MDILSGNSIDSNLTEQVLANNLRTLSAELAGLGKSPQVASEDLEKYKTVISNLFKSFQNAEKENILLVVCCVMDILRLVAPVEILSTSQAKKLFGLLCDCFFFLKNPEKSTYPQILHILRVLVDTSGCALVAKTSNAGILVKVLNNMLESVVANCGHTAEQLISENIRIILEEISEVTDVFITPILLCLAKEFKQHPKGRICSAVLFKANFSVKSYISTYLHDLFFTQAHSKGQIHTRKFKIAYSIYKINHDYLISILCGISQLFQSKDTGKVVKLVGKIASCKKSTLFSSNSHLFKAFLQLFEDKLEKIRVQMVGFILRFFKNHGEKKELMKEIKKLAVARLRDSSSKVREIVIKNICKGIQFVNMSKSVILKICERMRDVKLIVRQTALEELARIYYQKCVHLYVFSNGKEEDYRGIIDEIVKIFRVSTGEEQGNVVDAIEEVVIPLSLNAEQRGKALVCIVEDLSRNAKIVFGEIFKCKHFWAEVLESTLKSLNFNEALEVFCGNLKSPMQSLHIKNNLKLFSQPHVQLFETPEVKTLFLTLCSNSEYSEKCFAYQNAKSLINQHPQSVKTAFSQIKSRCFSLLICPDQIEHIITNYEIMDIISQSYPELLSPHLDKMIEELPRTSHKNQIFELISNANIQENANYKMIETAILSTFLESEDEDEVKAAGKVLKKMKLKFVKKIFAIACENSQLSVLKEIIKYLPGVVESHKDTMKALVISLITSKDSDINEKCAAVRLLKSLIKYMGLAPVKLFKYLRKLCMNLHKTLPESSNFSESEDLQFRTACLKSLLSLLCVPEYKSLLDYKALCCFAHCALNTDLQPAIGGILIKNIYEKPNLSPNLLSIIGLLLISNDAKIYKDAIIKVFKKMKEISLEQTDENIKAKLQPETYTAYLLYVLIKCNVQIKTCNAIIANYLKCLHQSHASIDVNYLVNLGERLKKCEVVGKRIESEIYTVKDIRGDLENVCNEFCLVVAENYIIKDFVEMDCRVLIPSAYFAKSRGGRISSPNGSARKIEGTPKSRRAPNSSPRHKEFKY